MSSRRKVRSRRKTRVNSPVIMYLLAEALAGNLSIDVEDKADTFSNRNLKIGKVNSKANQSLRLTYRKNSVNRHR